MILGPEGTLPWPPGGHGEFKRRIGAMRHGAEQRATERETHRQGPNYP